MVNNIEVIIPELNILKVIKNPLKLFKIIY